MLWVTEKSIDGGSQSIQAKKQDTPDSLGDVGSISSASNVGGDIKNLSSVVKSAKCKNPNLIKSNSFRTNFFTLGVKKAFIYLQKAFTKAPILHCWYRTVKRST